MNASKSTRACAPLLALLVVATFIVGLAPKAHATTPGENGVIASVKDGDVVYLDPATGSVTRPLKTIYYQQDPAWSPDGGWLALGIAGRVAVARHDGSDIDKFEFIGTAGAWDMSISWHPDGIHFIYVTHSGQLRSISRMGGDKVGITAGVSGATYSPDGQHIAVTRSDLEVIDPDGANPVTLLTLGGQQRAPDWSPDGSKIVFQSQGPDGWDIWVVNADGGSPTLLTPNAANDTDPVWAPDGSSILFRSERGHGGLFTVQPTGGEAVAIPSTSALRSPSWQPEVVGLRSSKTVINPGADITLDVALAHPIDNPEVALQQRTVGGGWHIIDQLTVAADGKASTKLTSVKATSDFRAVWTGDDSHPGATSLVVTVGVRALARGRMLRTDGREGVFALYRAGHRAWYATRIIPNHAGSRVCFRIHQMRGVWHEIGFDCFRLQRDSTLLVYMGPFDSGTRLRIHTEFRDKDHLPATSAWSYFRYVR